MRKLFITAARGRLGRAFTRLCDARSMVYEAATREELDVVDPDQVAAALDRLDPWAVIHTAGYGDVDGAELEPERCRRENTEGAVVVARACRARGIPLLGFSSDQVFAGDKRAPYLEVDAPAPLGVYGHSKAAGDAGVLAAHPDALIVRTGAWFGAAGPGDFDFVDAALVRLATGEAFAAADDILRSPAYLPDLVHACLDLLVDGERGLWHVGGPDAVSSAELARRAARQAGLDPTRVLGLPQAHLGQRAPRPRFAALASERGALLPPLADALARYLADRAAGAHQ